MAENGEVLELPTIVIGWNEADKIAHIQVNWEAFKTFEFAECVLGMALKQLENMKRTAQLQKLQQQAQEQIQLAGIQEELKRGRIT